MRLPPFDYLAPKTLREALSVMDQYRGKARIIAGGTEIILLMKAGLLRPVYLMSLKTVKTLKGIKEGKDKVTIGASTTLRDVSTSPLLNTTFKSLVQAVRLVAAPQIQNSATIAGNILQNTRCLFRNQSQLFRDGIEPCYKSGGKMCHAVKGGKRCLSVYQGDMAPVLMSLGSKVKLERKGSSRTIPLSEIFTGAGKEPISIRAEEIMTKIILPLPEGSYGSSYEKLRIRGSIEYPLAASAVFLSTGTDGKIRTARVVISGSGPAPKIVKECTDILVGKWPEEKEIETSARFAAKAAEVVNNLSAPASYRRKMIGVLTGRAIRNALNDIKTEL